MRKHSQSSAQARRRPRASKPLPPHTAPQGFLAAFDQLLGGAALPSLGKRRGRKPRVPLTQILPAFIFHFMNGAGTLAQHFFQLFGEPLADSSWSDRRARLPWEVFAELMRRMLRPRAHRRAHPEAFWRGWRLLALDGTQFSLSHTPQIKRTVSKARSRRGRAAFAKLTTGVLLEVGLHHPLAAASGRNGESEWELARGLLSHRPKGALLLADRLHGGAAFAVEALGVCQRVGSHFLFRARRTIKGRVRKRFKDGSRLIRVPVRQKGNPNLILQWPELREVRVRVSRKGHRSQELRLWTSLLDWQAAPALELAQLYAQRQATFLAGPEAQLQRDCSEQTAREIDEEVKKLLDRGYVEAKEVLTLHREQLERVSGELLKRETLEGAEFYRMIGKPIPAAKEAQPTPPVGALVAHAQASRPGKEASDG